MGEMRARPQHDGNPDLIVIYLLCRREIAGVWVAIIRIVLLGIGIWIVGFAAKVVNFCNILSKSEQNYFLILKSFH